MSVNELKYELYRELSKAGMEFKKATVLASETLDALADSTDAGEEDFLRELTKSKDLSFGKAAEIVSTIMDFVCKNEVKLVRYPGQRPPQEPEVKSTADAVAPKPTQKEEVSPSVSAIPTRVKSMQNFNPDPKVEGRIKKAGSHRIFKSAAEIGTKAKLSAETVHKYMAGALVPAGGAQFRERRVGKKVLLREYRLLPVEHWRLKSKPAQEPLPL